MRTSKFNFRSNIHLAFAVTLCVAGLSGQALAFDPKPKNEAVTEESGPFDLFKFGFNAYQKGEKKRAIEAFKYAADKGHRGARWALADMYDRGDGVTEDDYEAFKNYQKIANQGVEPGSQDEGYFVHALMSLAFYYQRGIPDSPVEVNLEAARQLYFQAASAFGVPEAQYRLGRMILEGRGGGDDIKLARKWLNRARSSGHPAASAVYGNLLFQDGEVVRGLALITSAYQRATPHDQDWIRELQEQAFILANENDRRTAIALSDEMLKKGLN